MNAIEVKNLTKKFDTFMLDRISFNVPSGSIVGLVGENGAGKTTTIKLIMNALERDDGSTRILGQENNTPHFASTKEDIGVVLDEAHFPEVLNALDIAKIMKNTYRNWSDTTYLSYLEQFQLPQKKQFKDYSRGMQMKLAIAVALSHDAKLLILDEATSGLDPMAREEILDIFHEFTRDESHSILLSSHIISDLEKVCDYITFIHNGKLKLSEEKDLLLEKYGILKIREDLLDSIPPEAIINKKKLYSGYELLVNKENIHSSFVCENATLEEIILLLVKEDTR